ncbi:response regulator transcription factor [Halarcobacter anaerophilus]|uniref:response regulator transcription factor n=1 Tax=Halarcobacter anaerophilus TaxID=877500 RepID=UPI001162C756|nr:response regulator transcription factor [Halarcobacter anaerophilus]QDF28937.1 two-component system response regulator [Halarcobacter anaerophilus]
MNNKEKILKELKILFVEDEINISKLLKDALADYFFSFTIANNGEEGLEKYKKINPDIIITDIMMPKLDGLEMTKRIREENETIPIIVLSAFSDKEKLLKAIDIGITKYFIKPFDPEEVLEYLCAIAKKLNKNRIVYLNKNFSFDRNTNNLYEDNVLVNITKREKSFINLLIKNKNDITSVDELKETLWEEEEISDERVRTFIKRLRKKTSKELIKNIAGQGYLIISDTI